MRKLLLAGTTVLALVLSAAAANAIPLLNKDASPYVVLTPEAQQPDHFGATFEGRSAFIDETAPNAAPVIEQRHWTGRSFQ